MNKVCDLNRGTLVAAIGHLDADGANVSDCTLGVVFEVTDAYGDGNGPMVRWCSGGACNVYEGDVREVL